MADVSRRRFLQYGVGTGAALALSGMARPAVAVAATVTALSGLEAR